MALCLRRQANINMMEGNRRYFQRLKGRSGDENKVFRGKNTLERMHIRLDTTNKKIIELKEAAMEPISNEAETKRTEKMKRVSVTCGTTSSNVHLDIWEFQKEIGEEVRYKKIHGVKFPKINGNYTYYTD